MTDDIITLLNIYYYYQFLVVSARSLIWLII